VITAGGTKINQAVCTKLDPVLCTCSGGCCYTPCIGVVFFPINNESQYLVVPKSHRADHKDAMLRGEYTVETLVLSPGDLLVGHPFLIHGGGAHKNVEINGGWLMHRGDASDYSTRGFCFADDVVRNQHLTCPFVFGVCMHALCCRRAKTHLCLHCRHVAGYLNAVETKGPLRNGCYRWSLAVSLLVWLILPCS